LVVRESCDGRNHDGISSRYSVSPTPSSGTSM
jgi:hypothetical protein